jgi:sec-independent protein translocase protein TatC
MFNAKKFKKYLPILLQEFKTRLLSILVLYIVVSGAIYYFAKDLLYKLILKSTVNVQFIYTNIWDAFLSDLSITFYFSFVIVSPYIIYHLYFFISPALKSREKKSLSHLMFFIFITNVCSNAITINYLLPMLAKTLIYSTEFYKPMISIKGYVSMFIDISFVLLIILQFPPVTVFLYRLHILSIKAMKNSRKYVLLLFLCVSAIITPPDVLSQIIFTAVFYLLYELTILYILVFDK